MLQTIQGQRPQAPSEAAESTQASRDTAAAHKPTPKFGSLDTPKETQPVEVYWTYAIALALVHVLAFIAFIPGIFGYLFTWTGLGVAILGHFVFGMLGVTVGYHRLLTHRGFTCPRWLEHTLAILGICNLQDSPARWVAIHRMHHKNSDEQSDPHSPLVSFFWGHMGWVMVQNREHRDIRGYERYVRDLLRDPFYLSLERNATWLQIYFLHALGFLVAGFVGGWLASGQPSGGVRMGLSLLFWGVFVRTVFVLHGTWAVNSITHVWGYRNYNTADHSRNNWLVALVSHGEGWHNNHHADQRAAAHGHKWWEFDMSWWVIRCLEKIGLAKDIVTPRSWNEPEQASCPPSA